MGQDELYNKLKLAIIDGLEYLRQNEKEYFHNNLFHYKDSNELSYLKTGYPYFSKSSYIQKDYYKLFDKNEICKNFESWKDFKNTIIKNEQFCRYNFLAEHAGNKSIEGKDFWDKFYPYYSLIQIIERYIHIYEIREFDDEKFKIIYHEWYNGFNLTELKFEIVIPILMTTFDFDDLEIDSQISIKRMSDLFQRSRNTIVSQNSASHVDVISCATHAFIIKGYSIENKSMHDPNSLTNSNAFREVIPSIDNLFAYLRGRLNIESGYCQIISHPINWANYWNFDLIPLQITSIKAYPEYFENYFWMNEPVVYSKELFKKDEIINYLNPFKGNIQVAISRLNNAFIRKHLDDSILDVTIALEALFMESKDNSEVTHKLATRVAGLCKKHPFENYSSFEVFQICKTIYSFRSAIIHSKAKKELEKSKKLKITHSSEISTIEIGIKILSHCLNIFINKGDNLKLEEIDKSLFE